MKYAGPQNPNSHQLNAKRRLHNTLPHVNGTVLWYAKNFCDNIGNYATAMRNGYWKYPALQPKMPFIDDKAPKKPKHVKPIWTDDGYVLFWNAPRGKKWNDVAVKYVVYRFDKGEHINTEDASKIVAITPRTFYKLPYEDGKKKYVYAITSLDRMSNESRVAKKKIKL